MVSYIDFHCHIDFYEDVNKVISNAKNNSVNIIINNGINKETNRKTLSYSKKYPEVKAALGMYPIDALKLNDSEIDSEIEFIRSNSDKIVAIGEVGMDYKFDDENREKQKEIFSKFIDLSIELDKPMFVHSRKAELDCIELLEEKKAKKVIMHCFTGKKKFYKRVIENGWFFSVPTSVKYDEQFQRMVEENPVSSLLTETDTPFLHPDREEKNEPANVVESYKMIASIKKMDLEEVKNIVFMNWQRLN